MKPYLFPPTALDGYKLGHPAQYPENTQKVFSNGTPRKSRQAGVQQVVFAGMQAFVVDLVEFWNNNFFSEPLQDVLERFDARTNSYLGPDSVNSDHIRALHNLGYLPLQIMALPEGSLVDMRVAPFVFFNTHDNFGWFTNSIETIMSVSIWGPCTSATTAHQYRKLLDKYAIQTVGNTGFVDWQGHDFSMRGINGLDGALASAFGHLISFCGTDTVPALDYVDHYYFAESTTKLVGGSIPATEHAVMCAGGLVNEMDTFVRLLTGVYPTGPVSIVSDTWDYWNVINVTLPAIKDIIMARQPDKLGRPGKLVIRPDSGDPIRIVAGYKYFEMMQNMSNAPAVDQLLESGYEYVLTLERVWFKINPPAQLDGSAFLTPTTIQPYEIKGTIEVLWEIFGGTTSKQGYKCLDEHIGLIYGDSITIERATEIVERLVAKGFASTNVVFGIGSYTYQMVTRDTHGWAVKATWAQVNGVANELFKDPKTDDGTKKSAKGLIAVYYNAETGHYEMKDQATWDDVMNCAYRSILVDGAVQNQQTLQEIRETLKNQYATQVAAGTNT